ncbi:MAG: L,D-transpeptidase [Fimbriimonadaceae bacterium]|nr:L,D-transpeptidase [Fimbriimonadaceae bacterium]
MQAAMSLVAVVALQKGPFPSVNFADQPGVTYVELRETGKILGVPIQWTLEGGTTIGDVPFDAQRARVLADGTKLVPIRSFAADGITISYDPVTEETVVAKDDETYRFVPTSQFVEISISDQTLRAWQGPYLYLETKVSTGKRGHFTPQGRFTAKTRERMRYSRKYDNAPMPWSVQINGDIFIHGSGSVPRYPASHGCVRMPLTGENAAKRFWNWVELGTPVHVVREFTRNKATVVTAASQPS